MITFNILIFLPRMSMQVFIMVNQLKMRKTVKNGKFFLDKGINIINTLGENGCYFKNNKGSL